MIKKTQKIKEELKPVVLRLQSEGIAVYTYTCESKQNKPIDSLYWYDDKQKRVLNIQPEYFGGYNLGVSYIPSRSNGSGCGLSPEDGTDADSILRYRDYPTWVNGVWHYKSIEDFIKRQTVLTFYKLDMPLNPLQSLHDLYKD